ncbi:MAG: DUF5671 domain-containing protein, partial [Patescibacteria group bacterium]
PVSRAAFSACGLAIVTLYWSAITFVTLLWQYINYFFPDILNQYYNYFSFTGPIRFAVSSLIIVFPVFILVSWYLNKVYAKETAVRESKIRKWLIYLTLFIASLIIIGDLVSVINTFLEGELKARFFLKALSVLLVAIVIFWYYLDDVRREITSKKMVKYFGVSTSAVVLISIISAFFIVGSPATARLMQLDQQKISDLQGIQYQIVNYWQTKEKLPAMLTDLTDNISGYVPSADPQSKTVYEYNIKDATNLFFELCAEFNREGNDQYGQFRPAIPEKGYEYGYADTDNWQHKAGRVCFERKIDKQLYPPLNKTK